MTQGRSQERDVANRAAATVYDAAELTTTRAIGQTEARTSTSRERLHFLDAARAIMLLCGIPMHVSEIYRLSGGWTYESPQRTFLASFMSGLIHSFRMPCFFVLSGFFAVMVIRSKGADAWIKQRAFRLCIPLLAASVFIAPPELVITRHFAQNMSWREAALDMLHASPVSLIGSRWFIVVLLLFCLTMYVGQVLFDRSGAATARISAVSVDWNRPELTVVLCLMLIVLSFGSIVVGQLLGDRLFHAPHVKEYVIYYLKYGGFFVLGSVIASTASMASFCRPSRTYIAVSLILLLIYMLSYFAFYTDDSGYPGLRKWVFLMAELPVGLMIGRTFFAILSRFMNDRNAIISYFVGASLVIYLFHILYLDLICGYLLSVSYGALGEMAIACSLTLVACLITFEIVRRTDVMSLLFNGGPIKI